MRFVRLENSGIFRLVGEEGVGTQGVSPALQARRLVAHDDVVQHSPPYTASMGLQSHVNYVFYNTVFYNTAIMSTNVFYNTAMRKELSEGVKLYSSSEKKSLVHPLITVVPYVDTAFDHHRPSAFIVPAFVSFVPICLGTRNWTRWTLPL